MIGSFSGYSFTKAHSASYVMVSYSCAFLKTHHPAHFLARVIHHRGGFYRRTAYVEEARRLGIAILPPSILVGDPHTRAEGPAAIRLGLDLVHGIRTATMTAIRRERDIAPFLGVLDLWFRCRPGPAELEALLHAGALAGLLASPDGEGKRAPYSAGALAWLVRRALATPRPTQAEDEWVRQEFAREFVGDPPVPADLAEPTQQACDLAAWRALDCLPRTHPFALWPLPARRRWHCRDVAPRNDGSEIVLLVWVITAKQVTAIQRHARDGSELAEPRSDPMAFVTLEDETGIAESTWFPEPYRRCGALIDAGAPFWVSGKVVVEFGVATIEIARAAGLEPRRR
jgi:DNA polymerase-3 subunit alpha/error-prone DNA polymerase